MKRKIILCSTFFALLFFLLSGGAIFAQESKLEFTQVTGEQNAKEVTFKVTGIEDEKQYEKLLVALRKDPNVTYCKLDKTYLCKMTLKNNVGANYIQNLLQAHGADFDFSSQTVIKVPAAGSTSGNIKKIDISSYSKEEMQLILFPKYNDTGNPEKDALDYKNAKEKWFENNKSYPAYIDTGNKTEDDLNYERSVREWTDHNPNKF